MTQQNHISISLLQLISAEWRVKMILSADTSQPDPDTPSLNQEKSLIN